MEAENEFSQNGQHDDEKRSFGTGKPKRNIFEFLMDELSWLGGKKSDTSEQAELGLNDAVDANAIRVPLPAYLADLYREKGYYAVINSVLEKEEEALIYKNEEADDTGEKGFVREKYEHILKYLLREHRENTQDCTNLFDDNVKDRLNHIKYQQGGVKARLVVLEGALLDLKTSLHTDQKLERIVLTSTINDLQKQLDDARQELALAKQNAFTCRFAELKHEWGQILDLQNFLHGQMKPFAVSAMADEYDRVKEDYIFWLEEMRSQYKKTYTAIQARLNIHNTLGFRFARFNPNLKSRRFFLASFGSLASVAAGWFFSIYTSTTNPTYISQSEENKAAIADSSYTKRTIRSLTNQSADGFTRKTDTSFIARPDTVGLLAADTSYSSRYDTSYVRQGNRQRATAFPANASVLSFVVDHLVRFASDGSAGSQRPLKGIGWKNFLFYSLIYVLGLGIVMHVVNFLLTPRLKREAIKRSEKDFSAEFSLDFEDHDNFLKFTKKASSWEGLWLQMMPFLFIALTIIAIIAATTRPDEFTSLYSAISIQVYATWLVLAFSGLGYLYISKIIEPRFFRTVEPDQAVRPDASAQEGPPENTAQKATVRPDASAQEGPPENRLREATISYVYRWYYYGEIIATMLLFFCFIVLLAVFYNRDGMQLQQIFLLGFVAMSLIAAFCLGYYFRTSGLVNNHSAYETILHSIELSLVQHRKNLYFDINQRLTESRAVQVNGFIDALMQLSTDRMVLKNHLYELSRYADHEAATKTVPPTVAEPQVNETAEKIRASSPLEDFLEWLASLFHVVGVRLPRWVSNLGRGKENTRSPQQQTGKGWWRVFRVRLQGFSQENNQNDAPPASTSTDTFTRKKELLEAIYFPALSQKIKSLEQLLSEKMTRLQLLTQEFDAYYYFSGAVGPAPAGNQGDFASSTSRENSTAPENQAAGTVYSGTKVQSMRTQIENLKQEYDTKGKEIAYLENFKILGHRKINAEATAAENCLREGFDIALWELEAKSSAGKSGKATGNGPQKPVPNEPEKPSSD